MAARRTLIRFLARDEFRVDKEAVFQVINAGLCRFAKTHAAQVPGDFQVPLVGFFGCGAQLLSRDVHVRLERSRSAVRPEVHHPPRVVGPVQFVHLCQEAVRSFEIRRRNIDLRTWGLPGINLAFQI